MRESKPHWRQARPPAVSLAILQVLQAAATAGASTSELRLKTKLTTKQVYEAYRRLSKRGQIEKHGDRWYLKGLTSWPTWAEQQPYQKEESHTQAG